MAALCLPSDHVFCDCRLSVIVQAMIVRGLSATRKLSQILDARPPRGFSVACGEPCRTMGILTFPSSTFRFCTKMRLPTQSRLCNGWGGALSEDCQRGIS